MKSSEFDDKKKEETKNSISKSTALDLLTTQMKSVKSNFYDFEDEVEDEVSNLGENDEDDDDNDDDNILNFGKKFEKKTKKKSKLQKTMIVPVIHLSDLIVRMLPQFLFQENLALCLKLNPPK